LLPLTFATKSRHPTILCLGAHSDDIEIGCGGAILRLVESYPAARFFWVVFSFSAQEKRKREAIASAELFLKRTTTRPTTLVQNFEDSFFPAQARDIKQFFEQIKRRVSPDLVLTHCRHDLHQDHRVICELTWNTFRDHLILEYEIPKYDGDLGSPNIFVHLTEGQCRQKINNILHAFSSQRKNHWFTEDTFRAVLRLRGIESNAASGFAEGFYGKKLVI
jgi:LmbE family N-acetylglucosaminyl deacetylase